MTQYEILSSNVNFFTPQYKNCALKLPPRAYELVDIILTVEASLVDVEERFKNLFRKQLFSK